MTIIDSYYYIWKSWLVAVLVYNKPNNNSTSILFSNIVRSVCTVTKQLSVIFPLYDAKLYNLIQSILTSFLRREIESSFISEKVGFCRGLLENKDFMTAGVGVKETSATWEACCRVPAGWARLWMNLADYFQPCVLGLMVISDALAWHCCVSFPHRKAEDRHWFTWL